MADQDRIDEFEERTGLKFDPEGPDLEECPGCMEDVQYVPDHSCGYTRSLNKEAADHEEWAHGGHYDDGRYDDY